MEKLGECVLHLPLLLLGGIQELMTNNIRKEGGKFFTFRQNILIWCLPPKRRLLRSSHKIFPQYIPLLEENIFSAIPSCMKCEVEQTPIHIKREFSIHYALYVIKQTNILVPMTHRQLYILHLHRLFSATCTISTCNNFN